MITVVSNKIAINKIKFIRNNPEMHFSCIFERNSLVYIYMGLFQHHTNKGILGNLRQKISFDTWKRIQAKETLGLGRRTIPNPLELLRRRCLSPIIDIKYLCNRFINESNKEVLLYNASLYSILEFSKFSAIKSLSYFYHQTRYRLVLMSFQDTTARIEITVKFL